MTHLSKFQTLSDWLSHLETAHHKNIDLGLDRVSTVARRLKLIGDRSFDLISGPWLGEAKIITVAGTNGKGSCVAVLTQLLLSQGVSVGGFTSPHLMRFNERIAINNTPCSDQVIIQAFNSIEAARGDISLSYFEFSTLAALLVFKSHNVDYILLEVGLGGRLDSTNLVDTDLAIITSIDLDHTEWLGDSREAIGLEKAGIIRPNRPLVSVVNNPPSSLLTVYDQHSPSYVLNQHFTYRHTNQEEIELTLINHPNLNSTFEINGSPCPPTINLGSPRLPLPSVVAACVAALLVKCLPPPSNLNHVLSSVTLAGRREVRRVNTTEFILDVAHNPAAVKQLAQHFDSASPLTVILGIMKDKDMINIIQTLEQIAHEWYVCDLHDARAAKAKDIIALINKGKAKRFDSVSDACKEALAKQKSTVLVTGSFVTVAEAAHFIDKATMYGS